MVTLEATIRNCAGIHVRPSGVIIQEAARYTGKILVKGKGMEINLTNIMGLIAMGLEKGDRVTISVEGPEEEQTARELKALFEREFDFPPRE
ncbi:MAG: HPr family phosphocarrier protein [Spirochaetales bacterium]|nr:HPr family phosphocarrier protein [Spirochaetales bacterium]